MSQDAPQQQDRDVDTLDHALREVDGGPQPPTDDHMLAMVESQLFSARPEPTALGRYQITERLGAGGMGVVYRAHDPELSRDVAIKLLHQHTARATAARTRLRQEARALADVSHPNVVQVYDVGTEEGSNAIYISMEFVPGVDLRQWLDERERPWRDVLDQFIAAGRGLAAAHDRGLVHRDFKPGNVLVGADGRPRVVDFGLACLSDAADTRRASVANNSGVSHQSGPSPGSLTETGVALGTPAYMAPEQHLGRTADARSDQYAFSLSLYEGLFGRRPFSSSTVRDLLLAKENHRIRVPRTRGVPRAMGSVLRRGLNPNRADRYPSMAAMLTALEHAANPRRSRTLVAGLAFGLVGTAAVTVWAMQDDTQQAAACPPAQQRLASVWDDERRGRLRHALTSSGLDYAGTTWSRIESHLDGYATQWGDAYERTCESIHRPDAQSGALDRQMACLSVRRDELGGLVDVLSSAEGQAVSKAIAAVTELRPIAGCEDPGPLVSEGNTDKTAADQIRRDLLKAESLGKVARYRDGLALAEPAQDRADALELPALRAEALLVRGLLHKGLGEPETAQRLLNDAALLATSLGHDAVAATAATDLVDVLGALRGRYDEALDWNRHAKAAIDRLGNEPTLEAERLTAVGNLELNLGHIDAALEAFEGSMELRRSTFGEGHPSLARARSNIGDVLIRAGRFDEALAATQEAVQLGEHAFGAEHPNVGLMRSRLANSWLRHGDYAKSADNAQRAIAILSKALGAEHANVAAVTLTLAQARQRQGRFEQAEALYMDALESIPTSANAVIITASLSDLARERRDYPTALAYAQRSRKLRDTLYGSDSTQAAVGLIFEGLSLALSQRDEEAFAAFDRARDLTAEQPLPLPIQVVFTAFEGRAHFYAGRHAQAIPLLRDALDKLGTLGAEPLDLADVRFHLLQALWELERHDESREQLAIVDKELAPLGTRAAYRRRPIREWIELQGIDYTLTVAGTAVPDDPAAG
ncbi:MAG: tetratricopeptide repeat protein [Deltaproteobacteria bacterium]|nr:tetratricopeptide repeat protein [Deltaproteobacteria bacterium]